MQTQTNSPILEKTSEEDPHSKETIDTLPTERLKTEEESILAGGGNLEVDKQDLEIEYLLESDKDLINVVKVNALVERYIKNYNSDELKTYKQSFKMLYQKYSNKRYIIHNIGNVITVMKNDKKKDIVMELKKPIYFYYEEYLDDMKRDISNKRAELQYEYQLLVNKIKLDIEEKKMFEKKRKQFIELLESYYSYTLYHNKINNISHNKKITLILNEILNESKKLNGNLYSIDESLIELINKQNSEKLNEYNNLIAKLQASKNLNDKQLLENIKQYINKQNLDNIFNDIKKIAKQQDNYINYIILHL